MPLPSINLNINNIIYASPEDGNLVYKYSPLQNLKGLNNGDIDLSPLRISAKEAEIDVNSPIDIDTELSYDDSINIIINDHINPIKVINSRFYLTSSTTYKIADRKGNIDTNIYTKENFPIETSLVKNVKSVVKLDFLGIFNGGNMPVGNYNFYFKLADADGNESDFISESGKVVCHIGMVNQPSSIRGGQLDENSNKLIKFRLNNLDLAYNYINIYYTRESGDGNTEILKTYKITDKFRINGLNTEISITGFENHVEIQNSEINIQYASFSASKTNENCQNITFVGNVTKNYELFKTLEKYSLFITPEIVTNETIGNLNYKYLDSDQDNGNEYYNTKNIYYKLSYWDEDIYRFGIVYILNDFSLSPVFNIRGIKELSETSLFYKEYSLSDALNYREDFILEKSIDENNPENAKGVFKINTNSSVFSGKDSISPIGLKFNFNNQVIEGTSKDGQKGLKELTKGFFIVRQKRIPTLLSQGVAIATSTKAKTPLIKGTFDDEVVTSNEYFSESFLTNYSGKPKLGRSYFKIEDVKNNALLCPEANLRTNVLNNFFNSSEFTLKRTKFSSSGIFVDPIGTRVEPGQTSNRVMFTLGNLVKNSIESNNTISTNLLLVESGIELINNTKNSFCSRSGNPSEAWKHSDPVLGNISDLRDNDVTENDWSLGTSKIRGDFNNYIGTDYDNLEFGQNYNIFQRDYNFEDKWKDYFRIRYNDSSSFMPVSDRFDWSDVVNSYTKNVYRGDCYINTYTHRMLSNFIDLELPTNNQIVDPWTWYKNYRVKETSLKISGDLIIDDTAQAYSDGTVEFSYKKVLDLFTYKTDQDAEDADNLTVSQVKGLTMPDSRKFKKYSEANGVFGATKINRADVNAVPIGHWVTYKICSNINTAMRDVDFSRPEEEAVHKVKRSFYPLQEIKASNKLPESTVINSGISKSLGNKYYYEVPDVPFIKSNFSNRIYFSDVLQESSFKNGNRIFRAQNYQDYTNEYGELVKLIEWYGKLIAVFEHGVVMIPVNERAMMTNANGENIFINTENPLPKNPSILSNTFGSLWSETIVKTQLYVYGLDTIAKKIWRTNGESFELISDMKIQKFLNDNINLKASDKDKKLWSRSIKAHYNAFKKDVIFVFSYDSVRWSICWNELLNIWSTRYLWFPEFSENINNIFYTFANEEQHPNKGNYLYKHGFAGTAEENLNIKSTYWYDEQHEFQFEFVVIGLQGIQKIFDNINLLSNLVPPKEFYFEIVGEGFDWSKDKDIIYNFNTEADFENYLNINQNIKKLPYVQHIQDFQYIDRPENKIRDLSINSSTKTKEKFVQVYQKGLNIKDVGRLKGNMQYIEDSWNIQIQPITFKYIYLNNGINYTKNFENKIRDKYIKIRVKYDGSDYAIINAINTFFTVSYS